MGEGTRPHNLNIIIIYIVAILASKEVLLVQNQEEMVIEGCC